MIKSPCVDKCQLNPKNQLCEGCFRSIEEISNWSTYSDNEKLQLLEILKERKKCVV